MATMRQFHFPSKTYVTPISVMWSVRQAVMGDYVSLENPPFKTDKQ